MLFPVRIAVGAAGFLQHLGTVGNGGIEGALEEIQEARRDGKKPVGKKRLKVLNKRPR